MDIKVAKKELRVAMEQLRKNLTPEQKDNFDKSICDQLIEKISRSNPKAVHSYIPMGAEIDIRPVLHYLLQNNIKVICPKALPKRTLVNLELENLEDLADGIYGTQHPNNNLVFEGQPDIFIIPGLAFDTNSYRLGYGSGYYDTFLPNCPDSLKLGICYPFQIIKEVPTEPHDIQLSEIITPLTS